MTHAERHIIDMYSHLLEGLSSIGKLELIERLSRSLRQGKGNTEDEFFQSFGAFPSEMSPEEIMQLTKS